MVATWVGAWVVGGGVVGIEVVGARVGKKKDPSVGKRPGLQSLTLVPPLTSEPQC